MCNDHAVLGGFVCRGAFADFSPSPFPEFPLNSSAFPFAGKDKQ
jgi:hypothetical protein